MIVKKNTKVWDSIKKNLLQEIPEIQTGWFVEQKYGPENDNLQMAQVAQWNNEGLPAAGIPPRPYFTIGYRDAVTKGGLQKQFAGVIKSIISGDSVLTPMKALGTSLEQTLRQVMIDWDTPPNSPKTIAIKGFNDPLVDSGELIANITSKVGKDI